MIEFINSNAGAELPSRYTQHILLAHALEAADNNHARGSHNPL